MLCHMYRDMKQPEDIKCKVTNSLQSSITSPWTSTLFYLVHYFGIKKEGRSKLVLTMYCIYNTKFVNIFKDFF